MAKCRRRAQPGPHKRTEPEGEVQEVNHPSSRGGKIFPNNRQRSVGPCCNTLEPEEVEIVEDCHPCSKISQMRKSIKVSGQCKSDP